MNDSTPSRTVAANVRAELARHNRTVQDLSGAVDLNRVTLGRRINGTLPFTIDELVAIADYLSIPLSTLLVGVATERAAAS